MRPQPGGNRTLAGRAAAVTVWAAILAPASSGTQLARITEPPPSDMTIASRPALKVTTPGRLAAVAETVPDVVSDKSPAGGIELAALAGHVTVTGFADGLAWLTVSSSATLTGPEYGP